MSLKPPLHDGEGDAMPCECVACRSPFITTNHRPRADRGPQQLIERNAGNAEAVPSQAVTR